MPKPDPDPDPVERQILEQLELLVQELGYLTEAICHMQHYFTGECEHTFVRPEPDAVQV